MGLADRIGVVLDESACEAAARTIRRGGELDCARERSQQVDDHLQQSFGGCGPPEGRAPRRPRVGRRLLGRTVDVEHDRLPERRALGR